MQETRLPVLYSGASHMALVVKNSPANAGDLRAMDLMLALGKSPGGEQDNPL